MAWFDELNNNLQTMQSVCRGIIIVLHYFIVAIMTREETERGRYDRWKITQQKILGFLFSLLLLWALLSSFLVARFIARTSLDELRRSAKIPQTLRTGTASKSGNSHSNYSNDAKAHQTSLENEETIDVDSLLIENRLEAKLRAKAWKYPLPGQTRRYFADPDRLEDLVAIGPHFLTTQSGCRMARWYYPTPHRKTRYRDCSNQSEEDANAKRLTVKALDSMEHGDTIYVTFLQLEEFVSTLLDKIQVNVAIISGQIQKVPPIFNQTVIASLLDHPRVMHWFCQNLPLYGGSNLRHPKLSPFPYGLKEVIQRPETRNKPLHSFQQIFLQSLEEPIAKDQTIMSGFLRASSPVRAAMMKGENTTELVPDKYMLEVARSQYILSPNGDRPECFRHYEAIGLGTIPITELDPFLFRHLKPAPVVYGSTQWNASQLDFSLPTTTTTTTSSSMVNRNMVLEEYWMEYMDWTVGRLLHWWNVETHRTLLVPELFFSDYVY